MCSLFLGSTSTLDIRNSRTRELNELADFTIRRLAENLVIPLWEVDEQWVEDIIVTEMSDKRIYAISVTGEGNLSEALKRDKAGGMEALTEALGDGFISRRRGVLKDNESIGSVELFVTQRYMVEALNREIVKIMLTVLVLNLILLVAFSITLRRTITYPVHRILNIANAIAGGDFSRRIDIRTDDEIGRLAEAINVMTRYLKESFEALQIKNMELTRLDELKDEFLANTSHELRTPLNGIIGIADSLIDGAAGPLPAEARKNLELIVAGGRRLANLVNDILDFSKLRNKDLVLNKKPVDIHGLTNVVISLYLPLIESGSVTFVNSITENTTFVYADENRLYQIMTNLLDNAVKFTEKGTITVSAEQEGDKLEIVVADTGIGIPENRLEAIFEAFEQADGSVEREYGGTGLGLSVTKSLVELHGGDIRVTSKVGEGSSFAFTLDIADSTGADAPRTDGPPVITMESGRRPVVGGEARETCRKTSEVRPNDALTGISDARTRILAVDDEPVNLKVIQNNLELTGFSVYTANSGVQALEMCDAVRPDLILLDVMMPRLNGFETARRIRIKYPKEVLPIIFLTAKDQVKDLMDGFVVGGNDYITKPISKNEILARIGFHLDLRRSQRRLQAAEESYRNLFNGAHEGIFQADPDGRLINANPSLMDILGYDVSEPMDFSNISLLEQCFPDPEARDDFLSELANERAVIDFEGKAQRRSEDEFWFSISAHVVLGQTGEILRFEGSLVDITERKRKEQVEREKEAAEAANRTKGAFLANMSHELRTPLNAILGYSQILQRATGLNEDQQEGVAIVQESARHLLTLINDILEFSKIEAGKLVLAPGEMDLHEFVDGVGGFMRLSAQRKELRFDIETTPDTPRFIVADEKRLRQVVLNLIGNAVKFTESGRVIFRVETMVRSGRGKEENVALRFEVEDTGVGISKDQLAIIFKPFEQVGDERSKASGTGLGLAISRRLVRLMGGDITVTSVPNQGSCFSFEIVVPVAPL